MVNSDSSEGIDDSFITAVLTVKLDTIVIQDAKPLTGSRMVDGPHRQMEHVCVIVNMVYVLFKRSFQWQEKSS